MIRIGRTGATLALILAAAVLHAQQRGGTPQTDQVTPVNSGANPYRVIRDWAQLTVSNRPWGGSNGVAAGHLRPDVRDGGGYQQRQRREEEDHVELGLAADQHNKYD